jgi:hypothetical protein
VALIVDEAQSLSHELLEEIRLLTNIEGPNGCSLAVALVGQPELAARLDHSDLRQLKQRVSSRCELAPLDLRETAAYIVSRVQVAGGKAQALFHKEAVVTIYERSKGIPRTINVICDNALVTGLALDRKPVGRDVILTVCQDFAIGASSSRNVPSIAASDHSLAAGSQSSGIAEAIPASAPAPEVRDVDSASDTPLGAELAKTASAARSGAWRTWLAVAVTLAGVLLAAAWVGDPTLLMSRPLPPVVEPFALSAVSAPLANEPPDVQAAASSDALATTPTVDHDDDSRSSAAASVGPVRTPTTDRHAELLLDNRESVKAPPVTAPPTPVAPPPASAAALPRAPVALPPPASVAALLPAPVTPPPPASVADPSPAVIATAMTASPGLFEPTASVGVGSTVSSNIPKVDVDSSARVAVNDEELVRQTLQQYRTAYDGLNARLAQSVYPSVNESALERAFGGLASQRLTFDACDIQLRGAQATARCRGSARYVAKIGSRDPHVEPRVWTFTLRKLGSKWEIEQARTF